MMERVKIMFGNDDAAAAGNNLPSLANLGSPRSNFQRFGSQEEGSYAESFQPITSTAESTEPQSIPQQRSSILSNAMPRQAWSDEMSYDDTQTIIEDIEELQKDKDKDLRDRDHSLSGMFSSTNILRLLTSRITLYKFIIAIWRYLCS